MFNHPVLFLCLMVLFIALVIWLLPKLWRLIKKIFRKIGEWLGMVEKPVTRTVPDVEPPVALPPEERSP